MSTLSETREQSESWPIDDTITLAKTQFLLPQTTAISVQVLSIQKLPPFTSQRAIANIKTWELKLPPIVLSG